MSIESRLRRIEVAVEDVGGSEELAPPVSEEHARVRARLRQVEEEFAALARRARTAEGGSPPRRKVS